MASRIEEVRISQVLVRDGRGLVRYLTCDGTVAQQAVLFDSISPEHQRVLLEHLRGRLKPLEGE